ncbi:TPA: hypothetical protein JBA00_14285 [Legionella pneumophila]|uniref:hypothetical protein n=1 Tax=Legionella pneumophila TaxID=446 RepID=UPI0007774AE1|nr:hypothetical protein [Legionella pneumophila]HAT8639791.1 hypothetical protein [Legionella pneumophila]
MRHLTKKNLNDLLVFLANCFCNRTIYVFGAGASAQYIPIKYNLYEETKKELLKIGAYPIDKNELTNSQINQLYICGSPFITEKRGNLVFQKENISFLDEISHNYPNLLNLLCALTYSLENENEIIQCPEYEIFNRSSFNSLFLTLNHDGLATRFINRMVLPLHGEITANQRAIIKTFLPMALDLDISKELDKNLHLATKEEEKILIKRAPYIEFVKQLNGLPYFINICIIGYSFFKKSYHEIYDTLTYDLLREYICSHNVNIGVIDRNPNYVADILSNNISTLNIKCFEIDWSSFAHALSFMENVTVLQNKKLWKFSQTNLNRFINLYDYFSIENTRKYRSRLFAKKTLNF